MSMKNRIFLLAALTLTVLCGAVGCKEEVVDEKARQAWLMKKNDDRHVQQALAHIKETDPQYPTVRDAAMAALCADLPLLKKLKENGFAKWDAPEIMIAACATPFPAVVRFIHQCGGDVNAKDEDGWTALMAAAYGSNLETIKYLVSQGADVNAKDKGGWTALMPAALRTNNLETIKYLVSHGADVNAKDTTHGKTALMYVAMHSLDVVKYLVSQGADVNAKDKYGWTVLMQAATRSNNLETVKYLVSQGADVNAKDEDGWTALMCAAGTANNVETVKYLVSQGADVNAKLDTFDTTALDKAKDEEVKKYLRSKGAKSGSELR